VQSRADSREGQTDTQRQTQQGRIGCSSRPDPLKLSKPASEGLVLPTKTHQTILLSCTAAGEPSTARPERSPSPPAGSGSAGGLQPSGRAHLLQRQDMGRGLEAPSSGGHPGAGAGGSPRAGRGLQADPWVLLGNPWCPSSGSCR